jgi:hypothetical protein
MAAHPEASKLAEVEVMKTTRWAFIQGTFGVCTAGFLLAACGGDDDDAANDNPDGTAACTANIMSNHGHKLTVTPADVAAGSPKDYDIQGSSSHSHTVTLSADDFAALASSSVTVTSSTDAGHSHEVEISC